MIYLVVSIFAVIVIVAITIRRLPYLRPTRLGLEIASPKPFIAQSSSPLQTLLGKVTSFFQGMSGLKDRYLHVNFSANNHVMRHSYAPVSAEMDSSKSTIALPDDNLPLTAHPGDFWQDEMQAPTGALELPTKGLITRRGEAQKIAHELIAQADESFRRKDYKNAEKYYLQAATKDPDNARIYNRLGVIYLNTKNYKDAVEAFRGALKFDDRVASRHFNLALAYLGKHDFRSAEKGLKEAIRLEPTNDKYRKTLLALQKQPA